VRSGLLTADANAWALDVTWGGSATSSGEPVVWGVLLRDGAGDIPWRADTTTSAENVVWGGACGGADCHDRPWSVDDHTVVWGTSNDGFTVVWGTEDGDTVVWGTEDGDTVVWGTSDNETVIWGTSGDDGMAGDPACEAADPAALI
jgi:hypothetical protein